MDMHPSEAPRPVLLKEHTSITGFLLGLLLPVLMLLSPALAFALGRALFHLLG